MRKFLAVLLIVAAASTTATIANAGIGVGLHYLRNLGDIDADESLDLSKDSFGIIGSLQKPSAGLLSFEAQVEYIFDYAGTGNDMWIPSGWLLAGKFIYGGAGIGIGHIDGDWQSDPFYALRAGVNLPLGGMSIDAYGTYQFWSDDDLHDLTGEDLDSVTFAAVLHFGGGK
jgi:hypothetical protein